MLQVQNVSRFFGDRQVLKDVTFNVRPGQMTGFVGGNGAGKTTTMRIILGVLSASAGQVSLNGKPLNQHLRSQFGYMPEERGLYPKMKVSEQLVYLARLHGLSTREARNSTGSLLERLGLAERSNDPLEGLSLGNQQRAQIAAALVHNPSVLVLDEPFSGLDPIATETVLTVLREYAAKGAPVLFSSHQLDIVERLCDDLVVIADGEIKASGEKNNIRDSFSDNSYEIQMLNDINWEWLRNFSNIDVVRCENNSALFRTDSANIASTVAAEAINHAELKSFQAIRPSLNQIFKEVVK